MRDLAVILVLIAGVAVVAALFGPDPEAIAGYATATDGDTLRLNGERIRLLGIDAPESNQTCKDAAGADWKCGQAARQFLAAALDGAVRCALEGRDKYGRHLAHCNAGQGDISEAIVDAGLAITDGEYLVAQAKARFARRGLWQGAFDDPADWRRHHGDTESFDLIGWIRGWIGQLTGATKLR